MPQPSLPTLPVSAKRLGLHPSSHGGLSVPNKDVLHDGRADLMASADRVCCRVVADKKVFRQLVSLSFWKIGNVIAGTKSSVRRSTGIVVEACPERMVDYADRGGRSVGVPRQRMLVGDSDLQRCASNADVCRLVAERAQKEREWTQE